MERVAVITGASQGLGAALARGLVERQWRVVLDARHADRLLAAVADLPPDRVVTVPGDVTDPDHRRALAAAAEALGAVSLVVNNASTLGASPLPALDEIPLDALRRILEVNVVAPIALIQALRPAFGTQPVIVNITSDAAVEAYETWGGYGASKAALEQASRVLAAEHPEWRVMVVDPGDMRTTMHQDAFPGEDISDRPLPETRVPAILALIDGEHPSGRYAAAEVPA